MKGSIEGEHAPPSDGEETIEYLTAPLLEALEYLLDKHGFRTEWSRVSHNQIFRDLKEDVDYTPEHMRKMVAGERTPQPEFMEVLASRMGEDPRVFREYRRWELEEALNVDPEFADTIWKIALHEKRLKESERPKGRKVIPGAKVRMKPA